MSFRNFLALFQTHPVDATLFVTLLVLAVLGAAVAIYVGIRIAFDFLRDRRRARAHRETRRVEHERARREEK